MRNSLITVNNFPKLGLIEFPTMQQYKTGHNLIIVKKKKKEPKFKGNNNCMNRTAKHTTKGVD